MTAAAPRLSSTVILVRERAGLEVLMVVRNAQSSFASALVFPGGTVDTDDRHEAWDEHTAGADGLAAEERAIRIAGFREMFEETGLLLADRSVAAAAGGFRDAVVRARARLDLSAMHPFAHWITPEMSPRRYDTHFRLCGLPTDAIAAPDGRETVAAEWLRPTEALELGRSGERTVLFPTRLNLELLAQSRSVEEAIDAARRRRVVTVTPRVERRASGTFVTIPDDAGYGVAEEFAPSTVRP